VRCFFEPRDIVSVIYARTETVQLMVRCEPRCLRAQARAHCSPGLKADARHRCAGEQPRAPLGRARLVPARAGGAA
jgi:hypothetical protein